MLNCFEFFSHFGDITQNIDLGSGPPPPPSFVFIFDLSQDTGRGFFSLLMFG